MFQDVTAQEHNLRFAILLLPREKKICYYFLFYLHFYSIGSKEMLRPMYLKNIEPRVKREGRYLKVVSQKKLCIKIPVNKVLSCPVSGLKKLFFTK